MAPYVATSALLSAGQASDSSQGGPHEGEREECFAPDLRVERERGCPPVPRRQGDVESSAERCRRAHAQCHEVHRLQLAVVRCLPLMTHSYEPHRTMVLQRRSHTSMATSARCTAESTRRTLEPTVSRALREDTLQEHRGLGDGLEGRVEGECLPSVPP